MQNLNPEPLPSGLGHNIHIVFEFNHIFSCRGLPAANEGQTKLSCEHLRTYSIFCLPLSAVTDQDTSKIKH